MEAARIAQRRGGGVGGGGGGGGGPAVVVGIGGETSLFCMISEVAGLLPPRCSPYSSPESAAKAAAVGELTPAVVWAAIEASCGKTDEELGRFLQANILVPKLCLCMAVMEQLGLTAVVYQPACGSCGGLLVHDSHSAEDGAERYWPAAPAATATSHKV